MVECGAGIPALAELMGREDVHGVERRRRGVTIESIGASRFHVRCQGYQRCLRRWTPGKLALDSLLACVIAVDDGSRKSRVGKRHRLTAELVQVMPRVLA